MTYIPCHLQRRTQTWRRFFSGAQNQVYHSTLPHTYTILVARGCSLLPQHLGGKGMLSAISPNILVARGCSLPFSPTSWWLGDAVCHSTTTSWCQGDNEGPSLLVQRETRAKASRAKMTTLYLQPANYCTTLCLASLAMQPITQPFNTSL